MARRDARRLRPAQGIAACVWAPATLRTHAGCSMGCQLAAATRCARGTDGRCRNRTLAAEQPRAGVRHRRRGRLRPARHRGAGRAGPSASRHHTRRGLRPPSAHAVRRPAAPATGLHPVVQYAAAGRCAGFICRTSRWLDLACHSRQRRRTAAVRQHSCLRLLPPVLSDPTLAGTGATIFDGRRPLGTANAAAAQTRRTLVAEASLGHALSAKGRTRRSVEYRGGWLHLAR